MVFLILGARFAIDPSSGESVNVVMANASDLATLHFSNLQEGWYVVGTGNRGSVFVFCRLLMCNVWSGSTGVASTMLTFGAVYFSVLTIASMM